MRLLLDTHAVLWWLEDNPRLGTHAKKAIADSSNECGISVASVFEIETKHRLGRLIMPSVLQLGWTAALTAERWNIWSVSLDHAHHAARLPGAHGDPFDRLLAAQANIENLTLVTCDPAFASFGTRTLW